MKGFALPAVVWVVAAIVIIGVAGSNLVGIANIFASITGETYVQGCPAKQGIAVIPLIGYYKCEIQGETCHSVVLPTAIIPYSYSVPCDSSTTACTMSLINDDCPGFASGQVISTAPVNRGASMTAQVLFCHRHIEVCYHPYSLMSYSPSGGATPVYTGNTYSCTIPSSATQLLSGCLDFFDGQCAPGSVSSRTLDFDKTSNYFDKWVFGPMEYNIFPHPTYGQVYCSGDGYLHKTTTVQLSSGCYAIPDMNSALPKQSCCPNAVSGNCVCNNNFKFDCASAPQCSILNPCPGSNYFVPDYADSSRKTAMRYSCVDSKCVAEKKTSECTTSEACATGTVCYLDPNTGIGSCQGSGSTPILPRQEGIVLPGAGLSWLDWLKMFSIAFVISLVGLGYLVYKAPIPVFKFLREPRMFIISLVLLSIVLMSVFATPVQLLTGSVYG